ncbi:hypothetical protein [Ruegeria atlantica]|uniref:hypothetical protein n=1 Tax=Ruegeria atlantica TaxID=81569 RepID=UPI00147A6A47|nr:hypothetical protein [Ruegeria atlantica]
MSSWPSYASIDPERQFLPVAVVERTELDDGAVRQERRFTATPDRRQVRAWLTGDDESSADNDLGLFRDWARANAHRAFRFPDETGASIRVRVVGGDGGITYQAQASEAGTRIWLLEMEVETI